MAGGASAVGISKVAAPWRQIFLAHISKMPSPEFAMATLHAVPAADASEATPTPTPTPTPYLPRLRFLIFRGMWSELPENKHNQAPKNERVYETDMPTFTTDVRMEKVSEIFSTSAGHGAWPQTQGSGGGGPVEAVWWVKEVMTQWRMRGEAFVVGPDIEDPAGEESSGVRTVKSAIGKRMRLAKDGKSGTADAEDWSWAREVTAHFGNLSPVMRGESRKDPTLQWIESRRYPYPSALVLPPI